jgi:hypothetical protein
LFTRSATRWSMLASTEWVPIYDRAP